MCQYVQDIASCRIDHRQPMNAAVYENFDGIVKGGVWSDADQWHHLLVQHTWNKHILFYHRFHIIHLYCTLTAPRVQFVFLQLFHGRIWWFIIHLQDLYKVRYGQHANKLLLLRVPERRRTHAIVDERIEGFLHQQLGVEDDQFGGGGYQIIALVKTKELHKDLWVVLLCNRKEKSNISIVYVLMKLILAKYFICLRRGTCLE